MNAQDLKNSILQLAVQGKLVEQRPEEGTAKELLEQIKAEKEQLIKDKKIKKEKPLPEITEEEISFEIPESWEWVRLNDLVSKTIKRGKSPTYVDISNTQVFAQKCNVKTDGIDMSLAMYLDENKLDKYATDEFLKDKDIVINSTGTGTMGRIGIFLDEDRIDDMCIVPDSHVTVVRVQNCLEPYYIFYILKSYQKYLESMGEGSTNQKELKPLTIMCLVLPLPPLEEQKRIVAKIEELLPYLEQYDKAYTKLETFNKKFPEDMKKSILQLAMQGKLVEQRPEEGTAEELYKQIVTEKEKLIKEGKIKKEKPLDKITADEIPFEIPKSWKWVRLNELCEKIGSGSTPTGGKNVYKERGIKFLRSQNVYNDGLRYEGIAYISEEQNRPSSIVKAKDILLNITGGSIGRCAIVPDDFDVANINQHVMIIRNIELDLRFWLHAVIVSAYIQNKIMDVQVGVSREGLSAEKLKNFLIPLPPLAEQKRIVNKLEKMLSYCDQLMK